VKGSTESSLKGPKLMSGAPVPGEHDAAGWRLRICGYCNSTPRELLGILRDSGPQAVQEVPGEFVVAIEGPDEQFLISSPYGVTQYFYLESARRLVHADTVLGVIRQAGLEWQWNWRALADLATLDHLLECETLHARVRRVPPGSVVHCRSGRVEIRQRTWREWHPPHAATVDEALRAMNEDTLRWSRGDIVVAMSGGFDSRAILSALLAAGLKPQLLTVGFPDSTDVVIARAIAARLGLPHDVVEVHPEDYATHGDEITAATSGTKLAWHWHSDLFMRRAGLDPASVLFAGANGEFARTYYLNFGVAAELAAAAPGPVLRALWTQKAKNIFRPEERRTLNPALQTFLDRTGQRERVERLVRLCPGGLLAGLDRFYLGQRVRNFIGNGLRLYGLHAQVRTPFLSREWVRAVWNLERRWKLGSNWHRYAIRQNEPRLMEFPEKGGSGPMAHGAPTLYWWPWRRRTPVKGYVDCRSWFRSPVIANFLRANAHRMEELVSAATVDAILREHERGGDRTRTLAFLLTMSFWVPQVTGGHSRGGSGDGGGRSDESRTSGVQRS
jgi:Asparagine synthase